MVALAVNLAARNVWPARTADSTHAALGQTKSYGLTEAGIDFNQITSKTLVSDGPARRLY